MSATAPFYEAGSMTAMEQPPLTKAPLGWLEAVVQDTPNDPDDKTFDITIQSAEDGKDYVFTYLLGDVRAELERRSTN